MKHGGWLALAATILITGCCDGGVPRSVWRGAYHFYTTDTDPVEVFYQRCRSVTEDCPFPADISIKIPRAYIITALPYKKTWFSCKLPSKIQASVVHIIIADPDGAPMSRSPYRQNPKPISRFKLSEVRIRRSRFAWNGTALHRLREEEQEKRKSAGGGGVSRAYPGTRGYFPILYYPENSNSENKKIYCTTRTPHKKHHNEKFCSYRFRLAQNFVVRASFADFRLNGGLKFAEERVRMLRETLCRFYPCNASK